MSLPDQGLVAIAPHYQILKELGVGGMGRVLLAWDSRLERHVAIKLLHRSPDHSSHDATLRFLHEARAVARLSHPNIVGIFDVGEAEGWSYMVMEYVQGRSLEAMIGDAPRIPVSLCAAVGVQICAALEYTHQRGIVHRDIKPANLILSRSGVAKLTDFGIVKVSGKGLAALEESGAAVGTLKYASPEQLLDASQVGPASDLYALAVTLFEMLSGEHPYESESVSDFVRKVFHAEPPALREYFWDIPEGFETILLRAMQREPGERYQSAADMGEALSQLIDNNSLQRILAGPLFKMRALSAPEAEPRPAETVASTHTDLRLVPNARKLLAGLRTDVGWIQVLAEELPMRESANLPKARFLERVMTAGFSGLIEINASVWCLVQNGWFLDFVSATLTPRIDKTGDEIFQILPDQIERVRLYAVGPSRSYLPLLMANLLEERGRSTADGSQPELASWPQLLERLPDLSGCLICKIAETLYCLGYSLGKLVFNLELHPGRVCQSEASLQQILARSHTLWDFYSAEFRQAPLNAEVLLGRAQGRLSYREPAPRLDDLRKGSLGAEALSALQANFGLDYDFDLQKPTSSILAQRVGSEDIVKGSRLHRLLEFWLGDLIPLLDRSGQKARFEPLLAAAGALATWRCYQQWQAAGQRITLDLCAYDAEGRVRLVVCQGDGDSAGLQACLGELLAVQGLKEFAALDAVLLLAPGAFTLDALAAYARCVEPRARGQAQLPGIPRDAKEPGFQLCLIEYAQPEKQFRLAAPSLYG